MTEAASAFSGVLRQADGLLSAGVGEELLMMSVAQGKYFNLNSVGARIWELLARPTSVEALLAALLSEYEVNDDTVRREVDEFLRALCERDLLAPSDVVS